MMSANNADQAARQAVAEAEAAAAEAVAEAEAAAAAALAVAEASATLGDTQAAEAYQLTIAILQDGEVELIPALLALIATAIEEGIATYLAEQAAAVAAYKEAGAQSSIANQQASTTYRSDVERVSRLLNEFESRIAGDFSK